MLTGWRYRIAAATGALLLTVGAVFAANASVSQEVATAYVPLLDRFGTGTQSGVPFVRTLILTTLAVLVSLVPLYKPRPQRILDTVHTSLKRVLAAGLALATVGFFDWSHRVPRTTLLLTFSVLSVVVPVFFVWIRRRPRGDGERVLIVGDDADQIETIATETSLPLLGYLCPTNAFAGDGNGVTAEETAPTALADGGDGGIERLGGLSRLEDVLVEFDVDTVVLAFHEPDRAEFFGALDACHEHGVAAKVHREYADTVLISQDAVDTLVDIELEPWDSQDYLFKRAFDVAFSGAALLFLSPVIALIVLAIKLEGEGPVFFTQTRTYLYGNTFEIRKFRTLKPKPGGEVGTTIEEDRHTPLGQFLRTTHLDELPQLWSILVGEMSVVGPRPAQTELEDEFENEADGWRQRWFVKPGLTGLAQIKEATSKDPARKLQYDLQYIRNQSFLYDVKILCRQLWKVFEDVVGLVRGE